VFDQIMTDPAHRRRGLASVVMTALTDAARAEGARRGLLLASEVGSLLYAALGWRTLSASTAAHTRLPPLSGS